MELAKLCGTHIQGFLVQRKGRDSGADPLREGAGLGKCDSARAYRPAASRESAELGGCCEAQQSSPAQTGLRQQTKQQVTLPVHWADLPMPGSPAQIRRARMHTYTRLSHPEPTTSGQALHHACPPRLQPACPNHAGRSYTEVTFKIGR